MDCAQCEDRLMDLLYEELEGAEAEAARSHLAGCASCKASFERLGGAKRMASELPFEQPSPAVDEVILRAARERARRQAGAAGATGAVGAAGEPAGETADDDAPGGLVRRLLDYLRGLRLGPQVAMGTVMLLMVAIGLWYMPSNRPHEPAAGETVVGPESSGEAAASGHLEPTPEAQPEPDEAADREQEAAEQPLAGAADDRERANEAAASRAQDEPPAPEGRQQRAAAEDRADRDAVRKRATARKKERLRRARRRAPSRTEADKADLAQPFAEAEGNRGVTSRSAGGQASGTGGAVDDRDGELQAQRQGPTSASTLLRRARNQRSSGNCSAAIADYERMLSRFPKHGEAPQAMLELGECYRRAGKLAQAEQWLRRASKHEGIRPAARRAMERVRRTRARRAAPASSMDAPAEAEAH